MEVLGGVLWELLEEESEKSVDILSSSDSVGYFTTTIRITNIDGLIEENDGGISVPRVWVVDNLQVLIERSGPKF